MTDRTDAPRQPRLELAGTGERLTPDAPHAGRMVAREIRIAAPVDVVWRALTDAEELTRWFPPEARVVPGAGGTLWRRWQSGEEIEERIEVWEPNRHLRSVGLAGAWAGIVTDYRLEGQRGSTMLRVVSSGFGEDASWDPLLDAFGGGWDFELRGLRHYLERHAGTPRVIALVRGHVPLGARESWRRIMGAGGWFGEAGLDALEPGSRYSARLATGESVSGGVQLWQPPHQFACTIDQLDDAYLRVDSRCLGDAGVPWIWLSAYGLPAARVAALEAAWQRSLDHVLARADGVPASKPR